MTLVMSKIPEDEINLDVHSKYIGIMAKRLNSITDNFRLWGIGRIRNIRKMDGKKESAYETIPTMSQYTPLLN